VALLRPEHHWPNNWSGKLACSTTRMCPCKQRPLWAQTITDVIVYELLRRLFHIGNFCFWVPFFKQLLFRNCVVDFVEICNVCVRKAIIKAAKRIINSDKICRNYCDFYFGVTFLEHSVYTFSAGLCPLTEFCQVQRFRYLITTIQQRAPPTFWWAQATMY